jgi:hypothetical protein
VTIAICIGLQLIYTYMPLFHRIFGSAPLGPREWMMVICAGLLVYVVAEIEKIVWRVSGKAETMET